MNDPDHATVPARADGGERKPGGTVLTRRRLLHHVAAAGIASCFAPMLRGGA